MSSPLKKFEKRCYESQHMHPREWGLLHVLQRVTKGCKQTLFFNGHAVALWFGGASKSSIYRSVAELEKSGWLVPINGLGKKRAKGTEQYEATMYQVLNHEQWTAKHGTKNCRASREPVPSTGMEPVPSTGPEPVPSTGMGQSQKCGEPVPYLGHSSVIDSSVKENSVKPSSVRGESDFLENREQKAKCLGTLFEASSPKYGTGVQSVPTLAELRTKLDYYAKHGGCEPEEYSALREQVEAMEARAKQ